MNTTDKIKKIRLPFIIIALMLFAWGCEKESVQKLEDRNWQETWSDNFDGSAGQLPDATKWTFDIGTGDGGWGNAELQTYTNNPENVSLDGEGNLVITATLKHRVCLRRNMGASKPV